MPGGRHQRHLRIVARRHVAQPHGLPADQAQCLHPVAQLLVRVDLGRGLVPGGAQAPGGDDRQRLAVVDQRDVDGAEAGHVEGVPNPAGRQEGAGDGAGGVQEADLDRGGGAGDAVDAGGALVGDVPGPGAAGRGGDGDLGDHAGVQGEDTCRGAVSGGGDHAGLQGEGHDGGEHVAAVGRGVHRPPVGLHLGEGPLQVGPGGRGRAYEPDLAGQRVAAADTVDLPRVRRAHRRQQDGVPQTRVFRQQPGVEERASRRASPHEQAGNGGLGTATGDLRGRGGCYGRHGPSFVFGV